MRAMTLDEFAQFAQGRTVRGIPRGFHGLVRRRLNQLQRKVALDIYRGILKRWRVRTGHSRANWLMSVDQAVRRIVELAEPITAKRPATAGEVASAVGALQPLGREDVSRVVWLTNNVNYAAILEKEDQAAAVSIAGVLGQLRPLRIDF